MFRGSALNERQLNTDLSKMATGGPVIRERGGEERERVVTWAGNWVV